MSNEKKESKKNKTKEIENLETELSELNNKFLRTLADFQNLRRRHDEEITNIRKYEGENLILRLLDVTDDFERAITTPSNVSEEVKKYLNGFEMIYAGFIGILKEFGVTEIDCIKKPFNPEEAEAILTEAKKDTEEGIVIDVLLKGYKYKDRVLRPAKVKVSK